jgi:DME family drug/metabolite transporter
MSQRGALFSATAAVLYGTAYVAIAIALRDFTPLTVAGWRGVVAAVILAGVLAIPGVHARRVARRSGGAAARLVVLGLVGGALFTVAMNVAVSQVGATVTAFVAGTYAVLAAVLAVPLLGERLERSTLAALGAALAGTLLLGNLFASAGSPAGIAAALVAAAAFGTYLVLSRRWSARYELDGLTMGFATMTISGGVSLAVALVSAEPMLPAEVHPEALLALAWLAVGPGAIAAVLVVAGMRRLEARRASFYLLLNPPTAAVLAFVLLGERLEPHQIVGGGLVLVAIAAASGLQRRQAKGGPV